MFEIHCCANGYSCDPSGKRCVRHSSESNVTEIQASVLKEKSSKRAKLIPLIFRPNEKCPDGKSECPLNASCCPNVEGNDVVGYSCCPYSKVNANCCCD